MSYEQDARHELISRLRNVYSSGGAVKKKMCPRGTNRRCIPKDSLKKADELLRRFKAKQPKKAKRKRAKRTAQAKPEKSYRSYRELLKDIRASDPTGNYKDQQREASKMWQFIQEEKQGAGVSGGSGHLPYGVDDYSRTYNPNQYGIYQRPVDGGVMIDSNYGYDHRPTMRGYSQGTGSSGGVLVDSFYSH